MKLTPPKKLTFWLSIVLGALGVVATFVTIPVVSSFAIWFVVVGLVLLALGNAVKGF